MKAFVIFALALAAASPVQADAPDPFNAWNSGDFTHAVEYARPQAQAGDADAQYLLGEAYRLGRGVKADPSTALGWYRRAAAQGHTRAQDSLGLLLFAQGQRAEAMPLLSQSADRGEPRALYLVGTAHFNGDFVTKDWPLAYAMMSRAADAGIAQARQSLTAMERYLTPTDKAKAQSLIAAQRTGAPPPAATSPVRTTVASPPRPSAPPAVTPTPVKQAQKPTPSPAPTKVAAAPAAAPVPAKAAETPPGRGSWRVQLGAFGSTERAEASWTTLTARNSELKALDHRVVEAGAVRRLQATGIASREAANALCRRIIAAGGACIPLAPSN